MDDVRGEIGELEQRIEGLTDSLERCRKVARAARAAVAGGLALLAAFVAGIVPDNVLWLIVATILLLGGFVLSGSNSSTIKQIEAKLAEFERLRNQLIDEIELRLAQEPPRLLH